MPSCTSPLESIGVEFGICRERTSQLVNVRGGIAKESSMSDCSVGPSSPTEAKACVENVKMSKRDKKMLINFFMLSSLSW